MPNPAPRSPELAAAATGLLILGAGSLFVGIPAAVIGAFQERMWLAAGTGYVAIGLLAFWAGAGLRRRNVEPRRERLAWGVLAGLLLLMAIRFALLPPKFPLALIEGALGLLGLVSVVQLASLPRIGSPGTVASSRSPSDRENTPYE
jgi:hypothetical protein